MIRAHFCWVLAQFWDSDGSNIIETFSKVKLSDLE